MNVMRHFRNVSLTSNRSWPIYEILGGKSQDTCESLSATPAALCSPVHRAQWAQVRHLEKRAANKGNILKLSGLHLLLLPSCDRSKELVEAEGAGEKAESMGTEGDVLQHHGVAPQADLHRAGVP